MKKMLSLLLLPLLVTSCGGGGKMNSSEDSTSSSASSTTPESSVPYSEWYNQSDPGNIVATFYDDFANGLDDSKWTLVNYGWGQNGTSLKNVMFSTDSTVVAQNGGTGGIVVLGGSGWFAPDEKTRGQGAAVVTRQTYGPGRYEIRMKILPRVGACTAAWTYYTNNGKTSDTIQYSEIDIEMPIQNSFKQFAAVTYDKYIDGVLRESSYKYVPTYPLNDGEWHTYAFDWRTGNDPYVAWYLDGKLVAKLNEHVPNYAAQYWFGNWYPNSDWAGEPLFERAYMYIDYVKILQNDDPFYPTELPGMASTENATNLGSNPLPVNNYISNGTFKTSTNESPILGWTLDGAVKNPNGLYLPSGSSASQMIYAQYDGFKFKIEGSVIGKVDIVIDYLFGTVKLGSSEVLSFDSAELETKDMIFTVNSKTNNVTNLRVRLVAKDDGGFVNNLAMYMIK
jgi:hypothetical protein